MKKGRRKKQDAGGWRERGGGLCRAASLSFEQVKDNGIQTGVEAEIQVVAICATGNGLQMGNKLELEAGFCLCNKPERGHIHARVLTSQAPGDTLTGES